MNSALHLIPYCIILLRFKIPHGLLLQVYKLVNVGGVCVCVGGGGGGKSI